MLYENLCLFEDFCWESYWNLYIIVGRWLCGKCMSFVRRYTSAEKAVEKIKYLSFELLCTSRTMAVPVTNVHKWVWIRSDTVKRPLTDSQNCNIRTQMRVHNYIVKLASRWLSVLLRQYLPSSVRTCCYSNATRRHQRTHTSRASGVLALGNGDLLEARKWAMSENGNYLSYIK